MPIKPAESSDEMEVNIYEYIKEQKNQRDARKANLYFDLIFVFKSDISTDNH